MNLPNQVLQEMRSNALEIIKEYSDNTTVGGVDEDGEITEMVMIPLTILFAELVSVWAGLAHTVEEKSIEEVESLLKGMFETTLRMGLDNARRAKKEIYEDAAAEVEKTYDPFSMVEDIIKKAQSHDSD